MGQVMKMGLRMIKKPFPNRLSRRKWTLCRWTQKSVIHPPTCPLCPIVRIQPNKKTGPKRNWSNLSPHRRNRGQENPARITQALKSQHDEPLIGSQSEPSDSVASHVRSLSDYKVDPDELTTEISVRLARHVASKRGFFSMIRKLAIVSLIIAVHIAALYIVGTRINGSLYGPE